MIDFKLETQPDEGGDDSKTLGNMSGAALAHGTRDGAGLEDHVQTTVKVASGPSGYYKARRYRAESHPMSCTARSHPCSTR